jgi:hypothetical protein
MDSLTLTAVIVIFLLCLGLYFATAPPPVIPPPVIPVPERQVHPLLALRPVLGRNVAALRLLM